MTTIFKTNFGEAISKSKELCADGPVHNMVLTVEESGTTLSDPFLERYRRKAELWQQPSCPPNMHFNHGEYINRFGDGIQRAIEELKNKATSNRAVVSLVDNRDIEASEDGKLPSLLLIQAGLDADNQNTLYLTAYYRALEVGTFLPVNCAEMRIIAERIISHMPTVHTRVFTIYAFRAHLVPDIRPLEKSQIDIANGTSGVIDTAVSACDHTRIAEWLEDKARPETIVETSGLASLCTAMRDANWRVDVAEIVERSVTSLTELQNYRRAGSHARSISERQDDISQSLVTAASLLRKQPS
ncbi:hypothetical protein [Gordonia sp. 'Campus']|uniref:hypothetical protein n=1 Tax=Gordonia sp. 'Campus' TaxID=2915824 RepID=UPI001EE425B3|nr:hypothetical protein [Gordonia sp. 'Campus']